MCHMFFFIFSTLSAQISNFSYAGIPDFGALKRNVTNRVAQKKEVHDATKTGFALWVTVYNDEPQERVGDSPLRYATFRITARETETCVVSTFVQKWEEESRGREREREREREKEKTREIEP